MRRWSEPSVIDRVTERQRVRDVQEAHHALDAIEETLHDLGESMRARKVNIEDDLEALRTQLRTVEAVLPRWEH